MTTPETHVELADRITVANFCTSIEAGMARTALEAEGIPVFFRDAETATIDLRSSGAIGWIELQVPTSDAFRARELIESVRRNEAARRKLREDSQSHGVSPPEDADRCLACNALLPESEDVCPGCGWSYGQENDPPDDDDAETTP